MGKHVVLGGEREIKRWQIWGALVLNEKLAKQGEGGNPQRRAREAALKNDD